MLKTAEKENSSIVEHCNHLLECGWGWDELEILVDAYSWRVFLVDCFGEEHVKALYGED
jgi:hypothetical protein